MGLRIQNNIEAFNTHRQLTATATQASKSMEKLSSGYRINRAADDAAGLGISEKMRGQIGGLAQAQRNAQDGISLVQTAEGALDEVHSMLQRVRDLKVQFNNGTLDGDDKDAIARRGRSRSPRKSARSRTDTKFNGKRAVRSTGTFTFQVGANDGETITVAPTDLGVDGRAGGLSERHALGARRPRRRHGAVSRRADVTSRHRHDDQERLHGPRPTSAPCRTASSTVWRTWRPTRRT